MIEINKTYLCDCMDLMSQLPDQKDNDRTILAIVDPPYGIGDFWNKSKLTYFYGKKNWNNMAPDKNYFKELFRVSQEQVIFGANYYMQYLENRNSWIIWDKCRNADKTHMSECELAWTSLNKVMRIVRLQWNGFRKCEKVYNNFHPNQRPIMLYKWILKNYAQPGWLILDTHMGSGSSVIACLEEGYDYIACEKDPDYYRDANNRIEPYLSMPKFDFGG